MIVINCGIQCFKHRKYEELKDWSNKKIGKKIGNRKLERIKEDRMLPGGRRYWCKWYNYIVFFVNDTYLFCMGSLLARNRVVTSITCHDDIAFKKENKKHVKVLTANGTYVNIVKCIQSRSYHDLDIFRDKGVRPFNVEVCIVEEVDAELPAHGLYTPHLQSDIMLIEYMGRRHLKEKTRWIELIENCTESKIMKNNKLCKPISVTEWIYKDLICFTTQNSYSVLDGAQVLGGPIAALKRVFGIHSFTSSSYKAANLIYYSKNLIEKPEIEGPGGPTLTPPPLTSPSTEVSPDEPTDASDSDGEPSATPAPTKPTIPIKVVGQGCCVAIFSKNNYRYLLAGLGFIIISVVIGLLVMLIVWVE